MSDVIDKKHILEAAIFAAGEPLPVERLLLLFPESERPTKPEIKGLLNELACVYEDRGVALVKVSSGYRFQAKQAYAPWLQRLWEKKPPRYTRAFLETLVLIAYKQPITRGEIEDVRGVAVSSNIVRQLMDREWIKIVGHKDVPGKPALFGTTKAFLDYFNLGKLSDLPPLAEVINLEAAAEKLGEQLTLGVDDAAPQVDGEEVAQEATVETPDAANDLDVDALIDSVLEPEAETETEEASA